MKYVLRRLGFYLLAAWASATLAFVIPRLMPGDPATAMFARFKGKLKPEAIDALKEAFGFTDDPLIVKYFSYPGHILTGDLGISVSHYPASVGSVIGSALVWLPASVVLNREGTKLNPLKSVEAIYWVL